jgi:hypothetical protein
MYDLSRNIDMKIILLGKKLHIFSGPFSAL